MSKNVVVFLFSLYSRGGLEKVTNVLAKELVTRGYQVVYAIDAIDEKHEIFPERVEVAIFGDYLAPNERHVLAFVRNFLLARSNLVRIKETYPNAVYVCVGSMYSGWAALSSKARPLFMWIHGPVKEVFASSEKWIINKKLFFLADIVVVLSENMRNEIGHVLGKELLHKTLVIPNPVSTITMEGLHSPGIKCFVYVGRLSFEKRVDRIIRTLPLIGRDNWKLLIIGDGPDKERLYRLAESLGVNENIEWAGWQSNPWGYIKERGGVEALLLTSDYEGYPTVLVEAMANGIPCVAVDCPTGPSDIIEDGVNGILIPLTSDEEIVERLSEVLQGFLEGKFVFDEEKIKDSVVEHDPAMVVEKWIDLIERYKA